MKLKMKYIAACAFLGMGAMGLTSCDDFLDREPITSVTPQAFFTTADQVAAYLNNYYDNSLVNSQGQTIAHSRGWHGGASRNDNNTDNYLWGDGDINWFDNNRRVPDGQNLKGHYGNVRVWNYFINTIAPKTEDGSISGNPEEIKHYLGEGYFFRALNYYNMMVRFGDLPIIKEVLVNEEASLQAQSVRAPRNEVARFILSDLDEAIKLLKDAGFKNNQRVNKQVALLFKSRVALFEGTFEKYHKGTGRVPGDSNWPGKDFSGNIDSEIAFFLGEAMDAAAKVADVAQLTANSHKMDPDYAQIYGWNPYFEMFSQPSLADVPEVLLWKEYNKGLSITHDVPNRLKEGDKAGYLRNAITAFVMQNGLPIYAEGSGYKGDKSLDDEFAGRDERLQLFSFANSTVVSSDVAEPIVADTGIVIKLMRPLITNSNLEVRNITGYRQRKYYTYDHNQKFSDELLGTNACPIFRSAEALLNYMEACYEKTGALDGKARGYWQKLRERAGVSTDIDKTINATDMAQEAAFNDLGVWSGDKMVDKTLYNIRRERRCEFIGEGMRWDDLKRWRSWDRLFTQKFIPEGFNLWDEAYKLYEDARDTEKIKADGTTESNCSMKSVSKYLRPLQRWETNNRWYKGYSWMKAYYLDPIGLQELKLAPNLYQNPYWPADKAGHALE